jgi:hypothetical protein
VDLDHSEDANVGLQLVSLFLLEIGAMVPYMMGVIFGFACSSLEMLQATMDSMKDVSLMTAQQVPQMSEDDIAR